MSQCETSGQHESTTNLRKLGFNSTVQRLTDRDFIQLIGCGNFKLYVTVNIVIRSLVIEFIEEHVTFVNLNFV